MWVRLRCKYSACLVSKVGTIPLHRRSFWHILSAEISITSWHAGLNRGFAKASSKTVTSGSWNIGSLPGCKLLCTPHVKQDNTWFTCKPLSTYDVSVPNMSWADSDQTNQHLGSCIANSALVPASKELCSEYEYVRRTDYIHPSTPNPRQAGDFLHVSSGFRHPEVPHVQTHGRCSTDPAAGTNCWSLLD